MLTVARFTHERVPARLAEFEDQLLSLIPGLRTDARTKGDGFTCTVSEADTWSTHHSAIVDFLRAGSPVIREPRAPIESAQVASL